MTYSCWTLSAESRASLMEMISPIFPDVIAHHVTRKNPSSDLPPVVKVEVIGEVVDPTGVQALVVTVEFDGEDPTMYRPDGNIYHITWSIDRSAGKKPFSSVAAINTAMAGMGEVEFMTYPDPIKVEATPEVRGQATGS